MVSESTITSIILGLLFINFIGFLLMGIDKQRAIKHKYRIPELSLWFVAIIGGAVGSFVGMNVFRHKTKHILFVVGMPALIIIHLGIVVYLKLS